MTRPDLLGREESERLEFKRQEILRDLDSVAREVVALLNADGGDIWIGVAETDGRATGVESVEGARAECARIVDHLVDAVEPSIVVDEVRVATEHVAGAELIRIRVAPDADRRPYCRLKRGGRWFEVRVGARTRLMDREEIAGRFRETAATDGEEVRAAGARLHELRDENAENARRHGIHGFWMAVRPVPAMALDVQDPRLDELGRNAELSGNRRLGFVVASQHYEPKRGRDYVQMGDWGRGLTIYDDGTVETVATLDHAMAMEPLHSEPRELTPYAILELPTSLLRLAKTLYDMPSATPAAAAPAGARRGTVLCDVAFFGLRGFRLRPGSPTRSQRWGAQAGTFDESDDLLTVRPFEMPSSEFAANPDALGWRIVRWIYQSFGLPESAIPEEFDRDSHRLRLGA